MRQVSGGSEIHSSKSMRSILWPTYSVIFASEFTMGLFAPILTLIFFSHHSSLFDASSSLSTRSFWYGLTIMLTQVCAIFANLGLSALSDRVGRKKGLLINFFGLIFQSLACLLALISGHLFLFIIAISISYLTYASRPIATAAIIDNTAKDKRFLYVGMIQFFTGSAYIIAPYLSGHLAILSIFTTPFTTPYLIAFSFAVISTLLITFLYKDKKRNFTKKTQYKINDIFILLKNKKILLLVILLMLDQLAWGTYFQFMPVIGKKIFHFSTIEVGTIFSVIGISLVLSAAAIIPLMQKLFSYKYIYLIGALCFISGILISLISSSHPSQSFAEAFFWISLFPTVAGDVIIFSMLTVLFSQNAPSHFQGLITGVIYTIAAGVTWGTAGILGGLLTGLEANASLYLSLLAAMIMLIASLTYARNFFNRIVR